MTFLSDRLAESQGENKLWEIQFIRSDKEKHIVEKSLSRVPSAYLNINKSYLRVIIKNGTCAHFRYPYKMNLW